MYHRYVEVRLLNPTQANLAPRIAHNGSGNVSWHIGAKSDNLDRGTVKRPESPHCLAASSQASMEGADSPAALMASARSWYSSGRLVAKVIGSSDPMHTRIAGASLPRSSGGKRSTNRIFCRTRARVRLAAPGTRRAEWTDEIERGCSGFVKGGGTSPTPGG